MKLLIEINLDNAAFEDDAGQEVHRVLITHSPAIQAMVNEGRREGVTLRDFNGNSIGAAELWNIEAYIGEFMLSEKEFIAQHLTTKPPEGVSLAVGELVTFTNPQGVVFKDRRVIGFDDGKVHLSGNTPYWFGVPANSLKKQ